MHHLCCPQANRSLREPGVQHPPHLPCPHPPQSPTAQATQTPALISFTAIPRQPCFLPDLGLHSSLSPASPTPRSQSCHTLSLTQPRWGQALIPPMSQRWPPVKAPSWMGMDHRNPGHTAGQRLSHHILLVPARVLPPALSSQHSPDLNHLLLTNQAAPYPTLPGSRRDSERTTA